MLGELRAGVITYRNVVREHMLAETLEEKQAAEKTLAGVVAGNDKIRRSYEAMITLPQERELYNDWAGDLGQIQARHRAGYGALAQGSGADTSRSA